MLQRRFAMNELYDLLRFFDDLFLEKVPRTMEFNKGAISNFPPMNLWVNEETKDLVFEFAVAGIPEECINIEFEGDYLLLNIANSGQVKREGFACYHTGIRSSSSKKKVYLPRSRYDIDGASANLKGGILIIAIPAKEEMKPRKLQIETKPKLDK
jgi:HSP20 family molecular chaperone IbpA